MPSVEKAGNIDHRDAGSILSTIRHRAKACTQTFGLLNRRPSQYRCVKALSERHTNARLVRFHSFRPGIASVMNTWKAANDEGLDSTTLATRFTRPQSASPTGSDVPARVRLMISTRSSIGPPLVYDASTVSFTAVSFAIGASLKNP